MSANRETEVHTPHVFNSLKYNKILQPAQLCSSASSEGLAIKCAKVVWPGAKFSAFLARELKK